MNTIKRICIFCFLVFGIIMQAEIFQNQLWNFSNTYFLSSRYEVSDSDMSLFLQDASSISKEHKVKIFSQYNEVDSQYHTTVYIYGSEDGVMNAIEEKTNIKECEYSSLISGISEVKYRNLTELQEVPTGYEYFVSFIGDEKDVNLVYEELSETYNITYPEYWNSTERDMIIIVWGMIVITMIITNIIDVISRKKEVTLRIFLGENENLIILKAVLNNIISDILIFGLAKIVLSNFVSGAYENRLVIVLYAMGILFSLFPYISFFFLDVKKVFANVIQSKKTVYMLYLLRFVVSAVAVFTIVTNFSSIQGNLLIDGNLLLLCDDANYFTIQSDNIEKEEDFWEVMYKEEYDILNPVICINILEDKNDLIFVNENAEYMLQEFGIKLDSIQKTSPDIVIFVPDGKRYEENKQMAVDELDFCLDYSQSELDRLNIQYVPYSENINFIYVDTNSTAGVEQTTNPIVIYQANRSIQINGGNLASYKAGAILYRCSESQIKDLCSLHSDEAQNYEPVITGVRDKYDYTHSFLVKLVSFLSSLCVVVLILDVFVIAAVNRFEFKQNALKISLKKILGYNLFERHKVKFKLILTEDLIIFILVILYSIIAVHTKVSICIEVCLAFFTIELIIIVFNVIHIEIINMQKTLKGGCL